MYAEGVRNTVFFEVGISEHGTKSHKMSCLSCTSSVPIVVLVNVKEILTFFSSSSNYYIFNMKVI